VTFVTVVVESVILVVLEMMLEMLEVIVLSEVDTVALIALATLVEFSVDKSTELMVEEVVLAFSTGEITDSIEVELVNVLFDCVCARTTNPDEYSEPAAKRLTAITIPMLIFLPKPGTFASAAENLRTRSYATTPRSPL
jgi:hypothetical protein